MHCAGWPSRPSQCEYNNLYGLPAIVGKRRHLWGQKSREFLWFEFSTAADQSNWACGSNVESNRGWSCLFRYLYSNSGYLSHKNTLEDLYIIRTLLKLVKCKNSTSTRWLRRREKNPLSAPGSEPTAFFSQGQFSILWSTVCMVSTIFKTNSSLIKKNIWWPGQLKTCTAPLFLSRMCSVGKLSFYKYFCVKFARTSFFRKKDKHILFSKEGLGLFCLKSTKIYLGS